MTLNICLCVERQKEKTLNICLCVECQKEKTLNICSCVERQKEKTHACDYCDVEQLDIHYHCLMACTPLLPVSCKLPVKNMAQLTVNPPLTRPPSLVVCYYRTSSVVPGVNLFILPNPAFFGCRVSWTDVSYFSRNEPECARAVSACRVWTWHVLRSLFSGAGDCSVAPLVPHQPLWCTGKSSFVLTHASAGTRGSCSPAAWACGLCSPFFLQHGPVVCVVLSSCWMGRWFVQSFLHVGWAFGLCSPFFL